MNSISFNRDVEAELENYSSSCLTLTNQQREIALLGNLYLNAESFMMREFLHNPLDKNIFVQLMSDLKNNDEFIKECLTFLKKHTLFSNNHHSSFFAKNFLLVTSSQNTINEDS